MQIKEEDLHRIKDLANTIIKGVKGKIVPELVLFAALEYYITNKGSTPGFTSVYDPEVLDEGSIEDL
jgi:hypothetical protein